MDAYELFRKLSTGVKFDKKRFQVDAERFQLVNKQSGNGVNDDKINIKAFDNINHSILCEKRKYDEVEKETENINDLTLLDGMSIPQNKNKKCKVALTEEKRLKLEKEKINQFRNHHHISVTGNCIPKPISEFIELSTTYNISQKLIYNITNCGYKCPTPIQMQAIPVMLQGRNVLACAPTGSGKTAAFLLPIIHYLGGPEKKGFRAVILSPTRELAKQTYRECLRLSEGCNFRVHIISKVNQALNKYGLKSSQKFDILITTPKRIIYLLNQDPPAISFSNVEWLIVDEVDKLFEDGTRCFRDQLETISKSCTNENLHKAMFSATNTPIVTKWCRRNLKGLITVTVGHRNAATDLVEQELLFVGAERGKLVALRNIIQKGVLPPVLVFVQSKERAQELFNELIYDGVNVDVIHADRTQTQRDNVVRCFREGKIWVLICTELMARGIDFKGVNLVINYDFPPSAISYVHRIGRTGRAGHKGKAITFFTVQDTTNLRSIATIMRESGCNVPDYMLAMKKHSKRERRKHECKAPIRESISTLPTFKRVQTFKKRKVAVNDSKKKSELKSEENKDKKINTKHLKKEK
ncbi:DExD-box helicase 52 [Bombus vancouverensis nearcticus]|uniref:Probable ATP-dependent RNA helicase DDX52 n=1 Tax=Bombus bifarius TaxID=103933 RepID=A0A6P8LZT7_9HYME|nr:probable ATP-dependent RNA helicase DDX52 isoform X1 [Bombus vancouverensis nearcticus]XP_033197632.1 probable ATP-dependent RNA helicase DDX52 isoform X1 [Bombus vancouverensis nearcticus]XP_033306634.1 probable ATP-dependent RNA helicase DDX52 isoform X1 [Bombus bifarius]XP_033306635.1 probable ATP-dependent RNA helicase DDX52 isoform X1 [Bombus bifarius]XP_033306636.1 probable ATP-dependent RNA helicase DDX52 isoform X1 [Bombus bifarius]